MLLSEYICLILRIKRFSKQRVCFLVIMYPSDCGIIIIYVVG